MLIFTITVVCWQSRDPNPDPHCGKLLDPNPDPHLGNLLDPRIGIRSEINYWIQIQIGSCLEVLVHCCHAWNFSPQVRFPHDAALC
jgi:hypothetical protein